jgi:hypothetical protein
VSNLVINISKNTACPQSNTFTGCDLPNQNCPSQQDNASNWNQPNLKTNTLPESVMQIILSQMISPNEKQMSPLIHRDIQWNCATRCNKPSLLTAHSFSYDQPWLLSRTIHDNHSHPSTTKMKSCIHQSRWIDTKYVHSLWFIKGINLNKLNKIKLHSNKRRLCWECSIHMESGIGMEVRAHIYEALATQQMCKSLFGCNRKIECMWSNNRFAGSQSCEAFVNMASYLLPW